MNALRKLYVVYYHLLFDLSLKPDTSLICLLSSESFLYLKLPPKMYLVRNVRNISVPLWIKNWIIKKNKNIVSWSALMTSSLLLLDALIDKISPILKKFISLRTKWATVWACGFWTKDWRTFQNFCLPINFGHQRILLNILCKMVIQIIASNHSNADTVLEVIPKHDQSHWLGS